MREIKFRIPIYEYGHNGRYVFKCFYYYSCSQGCITKSYSDIQLNNLCWKNEEQFTGLYDKDGKEIYENDIIKAVNYVDAKYMIVWNDSNAGWFPKILNPEYQCTYGTTWKSEICKDLVIGNIHENHELLGE